MRNQQERAGTMLGQGRQLEHGYADTPFCRLTQVLTWSCCHVHARLPLLWSQGHDRKKGGRTLQEATHTHHMKLPEPTKRIQDGAPCSRTGYRASPPPSSQVPMDPQKTKHRRIRPASCQPPPTSILNSHLQHVVSRHVLRRGPHRDLAVVHHQPHLRVQGTPATHVLGPGAGGSGNNIKGEQNRSHLKGVRAELGGLPQGGPG